MIYLVAEIACNHQGSVEVAKDLCEMAASPKRWDRDPSEQRSPYGFDAVKLCKRDLDREMARSQSESYYNGRHSFGRTYYEHRKELELDRSQISKVVAHARSKRLDVGITLCAPTLVDMAETIGFDFYKVASRDLTNEPLLEALAYTDTPVVISTGMATEEKMDVARKVLEGCDVTVCACTSSYPCEWKDVHLNQIHWLRDWIERHDLEWSVGFSDHTIGVQAPVAATALGVSYIEKHVTLWRGMRGSDHEPALGPDGVWRVARDVRNVERGMGVEAMVVPPSVREAREKLERSVAFESDAPEGTVIGSSNTMPLSPGTGVPWHQRASIYGERVKRDFHAQEIVDPSDTTGGE